MKIRGIYCLVVFFAVIALASFVSAAGNTTLIVHGAPFHNQVVRVLDPPSGGVLTSVYTKANYTGICTTSFTTTKTKVTFLVIDRNSGRSVGTYEDFGEYVTGGTIELYLPGAMNFSQPYVEEPPRTNVSANVSANSSVNVPLSSNISEEKIDEDGNETSFLSGVTSMVGAAFGWFKWRYLLYFAGIIVLIVVVIVGFVFGKDKFRRFMAEKEIESDEEDDFDSAPVEKRKPFTVAQKIADAEMRITEAQKELDELKEREIKKTERKLEMLKRLGNVQRRIDEKKELGDSNQF